MSADAASLHCPVCLHSGAFQCVDTLKNRLIYVINEKLNCPVCQEEVLGMDSLIRHLINHVNSPKTKINDTINDIKLLSETQKKLKKSKAVKNKTTSTTTNSPLKYVKIYPKLPVVPLNTPSTNGECSNNRIISDVKLEDLTAKENDSSCKLCGLRFVDINVLKMHMCLIHNVSELSNQVFSGYNCHMCPKKFKMRGSLMVHLRVAHFGFSSGNASSNLSSSEITNNADGESLADKTLLFKGEHKQWQCDVCQKFFTTKYFLKKHKRLHTGETPYACSQCNKTFTFQQSYHKHLLYHNDEKPHCCNVCGRAFKELSTLHNHLRIHTGEKPFSCETCGKSFRQRVSYLVHRRIHTGVMPYKCTACNKNFRYKVSQRTHKCQAQPPGTVIRQNVDLVEKLKRKQDSISNSTARVPNQTPSESTIPYSEISISEENAELVRNGAQLSLEDAASENFNLLAEAYGEAPQSNVINQKTYTCVNNNINSSLNELQAELDDIIESIPLEDNSVPSPSEILKNLCLSQNVIDEFEYMLPE